MNVNNMPTDLRDRLCYFIQNQNWNGLINILQPKSFSRNEFNNVDRKFVAKLAEILTRPELNLPCDLTIIILKCLTNVCLPHHDAKNPDNFSHKAIDIIKLNPDYKLNHCNKIYNALSMHNINKLDDKLLMKILMEYPDINFPYDGIVQWIINQLNVIINSNDITLNHWDIMRICFSFLCNISVDIHRDLPDNIHDPELKKIIVKLFALDYDTPQKITLLNRICCFIYNVMNIIDEYFLSDDLVNVTCGLLKADHLELNIAQDIILLLMNTQKFIRDTYDILPTEVKLCAFEVLYENLKNTIYNHDNDFTKFVLSSYTIEFLIHCFKQKSDLILKTVDTYVNGMEPMEITIILDILGLLTTSANTNYSILQNDLSLLINTVYLLKALHMAGKETNNCFTPIQKLSEIVPNTESTDVNAVTNERIQDHPAFGFKAALIRLIGNLVYQNKKNQDTVRDIDGIPLLLDCCNIDARNPLIIQWTILAIRNLTEGNNEIQELIRKSQKINYVDNAILQEFGIKLNENENGGATGIIALPQNNS